MIRIPKLSIINYRIATHEGDAARRLASQADHLLIIPTEYVPSRYKKMFSELKKLVEDTMDNLPDGCLLPVRLGNIRNSTAVKYIRLLIEIEDAQAEE